MLRNFLINKLNQYASKWVVLLIDLILVCISFVFAYFVRFNATFNFDVEMLLSQFPVVLCISLVSFLFVGSYKGVIRHTGIRDVFNVMIGVTFLSSFAIILVLLNRWFAIDSSFTIPISIIIIHYFVSVLVLIISRYAFKTFYNIITKEIGNKRNVLIFGAGDSGIITYGALTKDIQHKIEVVGFIDDDDNKINKQIDRVRIFDMESITKDFIHKKGIKEVIVSIQNINPSRLLKITDYFLHFDIEIKIVPPLAEWINSDLKASQIKTVKIEDLLDRSPILVENPILNKDLIEKVILITGAAGSIGGELIRQLSTYRCKHLVLVDQAESDLYNIQQELKREGKDHLCYFYN